MKKFAAIFPIIILASVLLSGCAGYKPQPNLPPYVTSVEVPIFINKTDQNIEAYITQRTIDEFLTDGKVTIGSENKADAVVRCELTKYVLTPILFDVNQTPQQYRLRIYAAITLFDNKNQRVLWTEKSLWEETTYYVVNNLGMPAEDESIARNRVMDQLAKRIVTRVIYGW